MHKWVVAGLFVLGCSVVGLFYLIAAQQTDPDAARRTLALARMVTGLWLLWTCLCGSAMWLLRHRARALVARLPGNPRVVFVLFCIALGGLEEAVTVAMTNLAPLFGAALGEVYITASANWLDVVALHSVVVFVPCFIAMALILSRWAFSPFALFLAFGAVGTLGEAIYSGQFDLWVQFPFWVWIYGLMVWMPAFCLPQTGARRPGVWAHVLLVPGIVLLAFPGVALVVWVITGVLEHPAVHF